MPDWSSDLRQRLSSLSLPAVREAEIVEELSQHLDDHWRDLVAQGTPADEATRLTLAEFRSGNLLASYMAALRQSNARPAVAIGAPAGSILRDAGQDVRYAARVFAKQPGFAAATALTLALGIGATTAIFSVLYGILLKPLPYADPSALVHVSHTTRNHGPATYLTYREHQRVFEAIGAWDNTEVSITGEGDPERVPAITVSDETLPLLGVRPIRGRLFTSDDDKRGRPLTVVLTHAYWMRRFGGADDAIGRRLQIDGRPAEVIGVLDASFKFLRHRPAVLLPIQLDPNAMGIQFGFQALARLKPGVTLDQANADLARMIPLLPPAFKILELRPNVGPLSNYVVGNVRNILWILMGAVGVVLLIACGNVANLFLIRAEGRRQDLAMRAALGASRGRIARALLSESVVLALAGGAGGVLLAGATVGLLRRIAPRNLPRVDEIALDPQVLLFAVAVSVLSGLLFGLFAVLKFGSPSVTALREGGRSASDTPGRHRTRHALVVTQIALALTLLIISGLMVRTFVALRNVPPGFTHANEVQTFRVAIPATIVADNTEAARAHQRIAERLAAVPGVTSVGLATSITMDGENNLNYVEVEGDSNPASRPLRRFKSVAPGYFETMGARLLAGRSITWADIFERRPVAMVSEALAREYWRDPAHALGKRVRGNNDRNPWREIVGVVANEHDDGPAQPPTAIAYWPMMSETYRWRTMAYAVRSTRTGLATFLGELRQAVWSVNPNLPLAAVETLDEIVERSMIQTSFAMTMLGIAAGVALLIGIVGMYGVMAFIAAQRTREIGLRMALGAQPADVKTMFVRQGLWLTVIGVAIGMVVALALTRALSALLFGVSPTDPLTFVAVPATLAAIAGLATYLPARRASYVDPLVALRS